MPQEFSAGAIIFNKTKNKPIEYLLLKYRARHWDFPKGHIEKGESYEETIKREAKEETGIRNIKIIKGFKKSIRYFFRQYTDKVSGFSAEGGSAKSGKSLKDKKRPWVFKMVTFYLAQSPTKKVKLSWEHQSYEWLIFDEAIKKITFKSSRELLTAAHQYLNEPR